jgi:hypothetical protein
MSTDKSALIFGACGDYLDQTCEQDNSVQADGECGDN